MGISLASVVSLATSQFLYQSPEDQARAMRAWACVAHRPDEKKIQTVVRMSNPEKHNLEKAAEVLGVTQATVILIGVYQFLFQGKEQQAAAIRQYAGRTEGTVEE